MVSAMTRIKILFIDDDAAIQVLATAMMNAGTFEVFSAKQTSEAEKILTQKMIDVIVCDVMMPEEDGLQYVTRLRKSGNKTPILMLSAVSDPVIMRQALNAGVTDYLVKPFDIHALQKKLLAMSGRKPAQPKPSGMFGWLKRSH